MTMMNEGYKVSEADGGLSATLAELLQGAARHTRYLVKSETGTAAYEFGKAEGPAIVLVHGWSQSHLSWHNQLLNERLASTCRLIALDLRGHGNSPDNAEPAIVPRMHATDIRAVLEQLDVANATLVGWSFGGLAIMDYVDTFGLDRVRNLVFLSSAAGEHPESRNVSIGPALDDAISPMTGLNQTTGTVHPVAIGSNVSATIAFTKACTSDELPAGDLLALSTAAAATPPAVRLATLNRYGPGGGAPDYTKTLLPKLKASCDVLIICGSEDRVVRPEASQRIAELTGGRLLTYAGTGHAPMMEQVDRFYCDLLGLRLVQSQKARAVARATPERKLAASLS